MGLMAKALLWGCAAVGAVVALTLAAPFLAALGLALIVYFLFRLGGTGTEPPDQGE